jgi:hypothetical protein
MINEKFLSSNMSKLKKTPKTKNSEYVVPLSASHEKINPQMMNLNYEVKVNILTSGVNG